LKEIRVAHLHRQADELLVGVYACSPQRAGFECEISDINITQ
jgi:regulation of enolase protein 1 (concanavalin A-like superfamily)